MNVNANLHSTTSLSLLASVFVLGAFPSEAAAPPVPPETIELTGIVRDVLPSHPDFDVVPNEGWGHYMWNIAPVLGGDGKPIYEGGGYKVQDQCLESTGRPICWTLYDPDLGDTPAVQGNPDSGAIQGAWTFATWFRDIPGINLSMAYTVTATLRKSGIYAGMYECNIPHFYPIDGLLFGNDFTGHNNFFTFEIVTDFTYDASANQEFLIKGDDDVWVFLNGQLVADLGGMNGSPEQWIDLDRLGLVDGETYPIHMFSANRNGDIKLHLVTSFIMGNSAPVTISAVFD